MSALRSALTVTACALLLGGCWRVESQTGANSADSHAPGTTLAKTPGPCRAYAAGTPGVERSYCNGPAVVKVTIGSRDHQLTGGSCRTVGGMFVLNLGVVSGPDLGGPKPDYVGLTVPTTTGAFNNAVISVILDGKAYALAGNSGTLAPNGGTFQGAAAADGTPVSGSFTC